MMRSSGGGKPCIQPIVLGSDAAANEVDRPRRGLSPGIDGLVGATNSGRRLGPLDFNAVCHGINGEPADVHAIVARYSQFMAKSDFPKLFINAEPGSILVGRQRELCRSWPNQQEVTVKGLHFIQEDSPQEIGQAIAQWLQTR